MSIFPSKMTRCTVLALGLVAAVSLLSTEALGCPTCRTALSGDPLARGIYWSILLMGAMPFVLIGSIGGWLIYMHRRRSRRNLEGAVY